MSKLQDYTRLAEFKKYLWQNGGGPDDITRFMFRSWDDLFGMERAEAEAWQLQSARQRFAELRPQLKSLDKQAKLAGIDEIKCLEDLVPLLFQHSQYKSYPMSLLEKRRFDMLTRWLDEYTTIDLSNFDASGCEGIDQWLEQLEIQARIFVTHTTGTSGKISFFPRTELEQFLFMYGYLKLFERYGDDPGTELGFDGERLPCIFPSARYGRYAANRLLDNYIKYVTPDQTQMYSLSQGTLSADLVSLGGRVRIAQAKGELHLMQLDNAQKIALKRYLEEVERRPEELEAFMEHIFTTLKGKKVYLLGQASSLTKAAERGLQQGIRRAFAPGSLGTIGGGDKGMNIPANWLELITEFTGIEGWSNNYSMSEKLGGYRMCSEGYYHIPPYHAPFLLEPRSGEILPRQGVQTGRYALFDFNPSSYWGGVISGDKVTIEWNRTCGCGRKGPHIHRDISRYSAEESGDDKVTCSATVDNTDAALRDLLSL